jgi:hypothetical protein
LVDRLAGTLETAYGHVPCVDSVGGAERLAVLTIGIDARAVDCPTPWVAGDAEAAATHATDDYPFLYLRQRAIPPLYLVALGLILAVSLVMVRWVSGPMRAMTRYADLFFMGAAFLLLETKSVVQFALLFGTTWFVNALVFAGVLVSVLLAIEVARRMTLPPPAILYGALLLALLLAWVVPPSALLELSVLPRFVVATAVSFAPIFLANLVFAQRFRGVGESTVAFGANLLGAMVGGLIEYVALLTGYQALLIVVAVAYGLAFLTGRAHFATRTAAA